MESSSSSSNLFTDVRYYLINSTNPQIEEQLNLNGAQADQYLSTFITHVICDNTDHPDYLEAKEVFELPIVTSEWVVKCLSTNFILPLDPFLSGATPLFSKICALNLNLQDDLAKKITAMLMFYGGSVYDNLSETCTHAFSCEYDLNTKNFFLSNNAKVKIVTPDWILDSIGANQLVDELKYNPKFLETNEENKEIIERLAREKNAQEVNVNDDILINSKVINNEIESNLAVKSPTHKPHKISLNTTHTVKHNQIISNVSNVPNPINADVLENQISSNTNIEREKEQNLNEQITQTTMQVPIMVENINNEDSTSLQQSNKIESPNQLDNSQSNSFNSANSKQKTKKTRKPPINPNTTPSTSTISAIDMDDIFQSVIGASEEEENEHSEVKLRVNKTNTAPLPVYLNLNSQNTTLVNSNQMSNISNSNQITFFPNFDDESLSHDTYLIQENSHLIQFDCCLLGCVFYVEVNEAYYSTDCANDWRRVIERFGGKIATEYYSNSDSNSDEITHVICSNRFSDIYKKAVLDRKRIVTPYWLEDVLQNQKLQSPFMAYHFPSPYDIKDGPLKNYIISIHGFTGKDKLILKTLIWLLNGKYSSFLSNITSFLITKNSEGLKMEKAKKWNINIVNGMWIMDLYLGNIQALTQPIEERYTNFNVNHFAYDHAYTKDFMEQWKSLIKLPVEKIKDAQLNQNAPLKQLNGSPLKRHNRALSVSPTNENTKICKRQDIHETNGSISWTKPQSKIPIVLFTGFYPSEVAQYQRDVTGLGGIIAKQVSQTTHLIVDKIERTAKLLKCISTCEHIVHIKWLLDSKLEGKFRDPKEQKTKFLRKKDNILDIP